MNKWINEYIYIYIYIYIYKYIYNRYIYKGASTFVELKNSEIVEFHVQTPSALFINRNSNQIGRCNNNNNNNNYNNN